MTTKQFFQGLLALIQLTTVTVVTLALVWAFFCLGFACDGQEITADYKAQISSALKAGDANKAKTLEGLAAYQLSRAQDAQRQLIEDNSEIFKSLGNLFKSAPRVAQLFTTAQTAMGTSPESEEAAIPLLITAVHEALTKGDFDIAPLVKYFTAYAAKEKARKAERSKENRLDEETWKLQKELNQIRKERELKQLRQRIQEERQRR